MATRPGNEVVRFGRQSAWLIDTRGGSVVDAVLSFGPFLVIGKRHDPLRGSRLRDDTGQEGSVMANIEAELTDIRRSETASEMDWAGPSWTSSIPALRLVGLAQQIAEDAAHAAAANALEAEPAPHRNGNRKGHLPSVGATER